MISALASGNDARRSPQEPRPLTSFFSSRTVWLAEGRLDWNSSFRVALALVAASVGGQRRKKVASATRVMSRLGLLAPKEALAKKRLCSKQWRA